MEIIFLGTTAIPDIEESVCLLCREFDNSVLLIECCSGILRQLKRLNINESDIKNIYISHKHGDHWLGLPWLILIKAQYFYTGEKLTSLNLICSKEVFSIIVHISCQIFPVVKEYVQKAVHHIRIKESFAEIPNTQFQIKGINVPHYVECFAPFVSGKNFRFIYSADTSINSKLWKFDNDASILIHESYGHKDNLNIENIFGHSMPDEVIKKFKKSKFSKLYLVGFKDSSTKEIFKKKFQAENNIFIPDDLEKIY